MGTREGRTSTFPTGGVQVSFRLDADLEVEEFDASARRWCGKDEQRFDGLAPKRLR